MTSLRTTNLSIEIGDKQICKQLNLDIEGGQVWGILGRNGVGKTTLLHTLAGLREAQSGDVFINNKNINQLSRKQVAQQLGLLLQHSEDPFPSTVIETVLSGRHPHINQWQWESKQDINIAQQALQSVDMHSMMHRSVNQLSGGERQRVAIATLLAQQPDVFLLDEPNSHLDLKYQIQILNNITQHIKTQHGIIIMSLHDINLAHHYCDHILLINETSDILLGKTANVLNEENLQRAYNCKIKKMNADDKIIYVPEF